MTINLTKGQRVDLDKEAPGLKKIRVGLKWALKPGQTADLDASVVLLKANKDDEPERMLQGGTENTPRGLCYYNHRTHPGISHMGDSLSGGSNNNDDETINIELEKVDAEADKLLVVCTSYSEGTPMTFGKVASPKLTIYNDETGEALYSFELDEDASTATAVELGRFYRRNGSWRFTALETIHGSSKNGLADILAKYYVN